MPFSNIPAHEHDGVDISTGTLDGDRLPDMSDMKKGAVPARGTIAGKFLRDDATFQAGSGGGGHGYFPSGW